MNYFGIKLKYFSLVKEGHYFFFFFTEERGSLLFTIMVIEKTFQSESKIFSKDDMSSNNTHGTNTLPGYDKHNPVNSWSV